MSAMPPAGKATTTRTGFKGYCCAGAAAGSAAAKMTNRTAAMRIFDSLPAASLARELEALEAVQRVLDSLLPQPARAIGEPGPSLHQQFLPQTIGLEIDDG